MKTSDNAERGKVTLELKGKEYTLLELDLRELGDLENFIRAKYAKLYRQSANGVKVKEREARVLEILRTPYSTEQLNKEMAAYDVLYFVAFLMLKHNPGITEEGMGAVVDQSNIQALTTAMNSFGEDKKNPPQAAKGSP